MGQRRDFTDVQQNHKKLRKKRGPEKAASKKLQCGKAHQLESKIGERRGENMRYRTDLQEPEEQKKAYNKSVAMW